MEARTIIHNVIILGRKEGMADALEYLHGQGVTIRLAVSPDSAEANPRLHMIAKQYGISLVADDTVLYEAIKKNDPMVQDIDLVISYLYPKKILQPLHDLPAHGCINFHPAPLPDYKSRAGYNTAILDQRQDYGVSAHYILSHEFDAGPIIDVLRFPIDPHAETVISLERTAQQKLQELFRTTMDRLIRGEKLQTSPNVGGLYLTSQQLEEMKKVDLEKDSPEIVARKIRAFFFPPYTGAYIMIGDTKFTLVDQETLDLIAEMLKKKS